MIARTSSKVFHVRLNAMFPQTSLLNVWFMSWIAIWTRHQLNNCKWRFRCGWIQPKELRIQQGLKQSDVIFRFRCYYTLTLSFLYTLWLCIMLWPVNHGYIYIYAIYIMCVCVYVCLCVCVCVCVCVCLCVCVCVCEEVKLCSYVCFHFYGRNRN